jgi:hypothetical protein
LAEFFTAAIKVGCKPCFTSTSSSFLDRGISDLAKSQEFHEHLRWCIIFSVKTFDKKA